METEELNDYSSAFIVKIATNGDIILVVGPEQRKLQVNSCVLKNASKVFNAMFGPHFREGQDFHGKSPKEISMPEDNAHALTIICRILHLCNDSIPDSLTPSEVLQIAITADKFDCVMRLKFHTVKWLNPGNTHDTLELGRLSVASYILNNAHAFGELTFAMISRSRGSYIRLADNFSDYIPQKSFWLLEERKTVLRIKLEQLILRRVSYGTCSNVLGECDYPSRDARAYIQLLQSAGMWPMATVDMSVSEAIDVLENMGNPMVSFYNNKCDYLSVHKTQFYKRNYTGDLDELKNGVGLCLDCVLSGSTAATPDCRIKH